MLRIVAVICCILAVHAQFGGDYHHDDNSRGYHDIVPIPYEFRYEAPAIGGYSSRKESGDGYGRVTGSYSISEEDGRSRIVEYIADEDGFRASISTNEHGTANQNPADITLYSSADGTQY